MAKTKTPFLSLGAQGSIGNTLTSQKRGTATLLREKPIPAYRYSLPQAYQRWLYEDYAYLWTKQDAATRAKYRAAGVRYHLTAFQYWMKVMLTTLPDIAGWWKLDDMSGATTPDSSRNANTGTIFGASPITGLIDGAAYFDGINNYIEIPHHPSLIVNYPCSWEFWFNWHRIPNLFRFYIQKGPATWDTVNYAFWCPPLWTAIRFGAGFAGVNRQHVITPVLVINARYHIILTYNGIRLISYIDGREFLNTPQTGNLSTLDWPLWLGRYDIYYEHFTLDNFIIYTRCLDATEALRHSERRYPL